MKNMIKVCFLLLSSMGFFQAQAQSAVAKDTEWLEKEINTLAKNKKSESTQQYAFTDCSCKYSAKINDGGFNMDKNFSFNLNEINNLTYVKNEDQTYELRMKMKTDSKMADFFDLGLIKTTLYTNEEDKVKEIVIKLRNAVKTCSAGKKSSD